MKQKAIKKYIEKHSPFYNESNVRTLMDFLRKNHANIDDELQSMLLYHTNSTQHSLLKQMLSIYRESLKRHANKSKCKTNVKNLSPGSISQSAHLIFTPMGNKR